MSSAAEFLPSSRSLKALAEAAEGCRGCELYKDATQVVFGRGRKSAELMLVGEQPGDKEDQEGEPFVGPAGRLLDRPLESPLAPVAAVTIHPSAILRLRDHDEREAELAAFVADLEVVATALLGAAR